MGALNELINELERQDAQTAWVGFALIVKNMEERTNAGSVDLATDADLHQIISVVRATQKQHEFTADNLACILAASLYTLEAMRQENKAQ